VANNPKIIVQEAEPALPKKTLQITGDELGPQINMNQVKKQPVLSKKTLQITGDELGPQINMNQVKKPTAGPTNRRESVI